MNIGVLLGVARLYQKLGRRYVWVTGTRRVEAVSGLVFHNLLFAR